MSRWLVFGERRAEQSRPSAGSVGGGSAAGRRRQRLNVEALEERLTLTASPLTGGIHAAVAAQVAPAYGTAAATTTVSASTTQAGFGQAVVLTSTVSPTAPGGVAPTGNVTFFDGGVLLGTAPLVNGAASITTWDGFLAGSNPVKAAYWGDANYSVADSGYLDVEVSKTVTTTTLSATPGSGSVNFTATVAPAGPNAATPTGVVAFYDGGNLVGSVLLADGKATLNQGMNGSGNHAYTATYYGDNGFNGSTTRAATVQALAIDSSQTTLTAQTVKNAHGAAVGLGLYASVTDPKTGHAPLKGTVTFSVDGRVISTVTLHAGGSAGVFVPLKVAKGHTFSARYSGTTGVRASAATISL